MHLVRVIDPALRGEPLRYFVVLMNLRYFSSKHVTFDFLARLGSHFTTVLEITDRYALVFVPEINRVTLVLLLVRSENSLTWCNRVELIFQGNLLICRPLHRRVLTSLQLPTILSIENTCRVYGVSIPLRSLMLDVTHHGSLTSTRFSAECDVIQVRLIEQVCWLMICFASLSV